MSPDRPYAGILLMLLFCLLAPVADAVAKVLGGRLPILELVVARFAVQAALGVGAARLTGRPLALPRRLIAPLALRTLLQMAGIALMILALQFLPLADAIAIAYVMPFLILLAGRWLLAEQVGARRLLACVVGFAGTLMVLQPSFAEVGWLALLPLAVAVIFTAFMLITRTIARAADPLALQGWAGVIGLALGAPLLAAFTGSGLAHLAPVWPAPGDWAPILAMGVLGAGAHLAMTFALRHAPAATLAPIQYLEIPVATAVGWLWFAELPGPLAAAGIALTMAAGLYIVLRERALSRPAAAPPGPAPAP